MAAVCFIYKWLRKREQDERILHTCKTSNELWIYSRFRSRKIHLKQSLLKRLKLCLFPMCASVSLSLSLGNHLLTNSFNSSCSYFFSRSLQFKSVLLQFDVLFIAIFPSFIVVIHHQKMNQVLRHLINYAFLSDWLLSV